MVSPDNDGSPIKFTNNPVVPKYNSMPPVIGVTHGAIRLGIEYRNEDMDGGCGVFCIDCSSPV